MDIFYGGTSWYGWVNRSSEQGGPRTFERLFQISIKRGGNGRLKKGDGNTNKYGLQAKGSEKIIGLGGKMMSVSVQVRCAMQREKIGENFHARTVSSQRVGRGD